MMQIQILAKKFCDFFFCDLSTVDYSSRYHAVIPCYRDNVIRIGLTRTKSGTTLSVSLRSKNHTKSFLKKIDDNNDLYRIINNLELYAMSDISFLSVTDPIVIRFFEEKLHMEKSLLTIKKEMIDDKNRSAALYY